MRGNSEAVEVVVKIIVNGKRGWRKPKKIWIDRIKNETEIDGMR